VREIERVLEFFCEECRVRKCPLFQAERE